EEAPVRLTRNRRFGAVHDQAEGAQWFGRLHLLRLALPARGALVPVGRPASSPVTTAQCAAEAETGHAILFHLPSVADAIRPVGRRRVPRGSRPAKVSAMNKQATEDPGAYIGSEPEREAETIPGRVDPKDE